MYLKYEDPDVKLDVFKSVEEEDLDNIRFYVTDGADPDLRNDMTNMPLLHYAVANGKLAAAAVLLELGADPNLRGGPSGYTALHFAAYRPNPQMAELLLKNHAEIDAAAQGRQTPLHLAAHFGSLEVATMLADAGANLGAQDERGLTPRDTALAQVDESFSFAHEPYFQVARFLEQRMLGPKIAELQRGKVEQDLSALKRHNPQRFKLKM